MEPSTKEVRFWRAIASTISLLLAICVAANSVRAETVPFEITLLLFGGIVAIGIGNAIVNPRSSPVILTDHEEERFRSRQYLVGCAFSLILVLLIVLTDLRNTSLAWLFGPIIVLPFILLLRERFLRN